MIKITVDTSKLDRLTQNLEKNVDNVLRKLAEATEAKAEGYMEGGKSGRVYTVYVDGVKRSHQASAPGEAPAILTGALKKSIQTKKEDRLTWAVIANTPYARRLEYGGRDRRGVYIAARPYLRPAVISAVQNAGQMLLEAIKL